MYTGYGSSGVDHFGFRALTAPNSHPSQTSLDRRQTNLPMSRRDEVKLECIRIPTICTQQMLEAIK